MLCFARFVGLHRLVYSSLCLLLLGAGTGCTEFVQPRNSRPDTISNEDVAQIQPVIHSDSFTMNDLDMSRQLVAGVYPVESNRWRWTGGSFSILLASPHGAATRGANLVFAFYLPDAILHRTGPVTLTAYLNETEVGMKTFGAAGLQRFSARVKPELLRQSPAAVEFHMDRYVDRGVLEDRELGVIADSIGLESQ
jgi:hypothetical protein